MEIAIHKQLFHKNIAQVYQVVRREDKIYLIMEYCPNGELYQRIVDNGPMPEQEACRVVRQIVSALAYLKKMGISHRDIKPENIMLDKNWNVKLVDFGFACYSKGAKGPMKKTVCGTPAYAAPEVHARQEYNPEHVDVWAVGVTLYAILSSKLPF
jgi:serine/threonine protein kinase